MPVRAMLLFVCVLACVLACFVALLAACLFVCFFPFLVIGWKLVALIHITFVTCVTLGINRCSKVRVVGFVCMCACLFVCLFV